MVTLRVERVLQLNKEVSQLAKELSPRPQEIELRSWVVSKLEWLVRRVLKWTEETASVTIFGSLQTQLYLPQGDVDIVINHRYMNAASGKDKKTINILDLTVQEALRSLAKNAPWNICDQNSIELLLHIRIPILKFKTRIGGLRVDITANNTSGKSSSYIVSQWVDVSYSPNLRPLTLVLKSWMTKHGFAEVFTGGLGGYALVNMLVSVMQHAGSILKDDDAPLAKILFLFFETFGFEFDYRTKGISVRLGKFVDKPHEIHRIGYSIKGDTGVRLYIEDPTDTSNNISKGTFRMDEIREAIMNAYLRLDAALDGQLVSNKESGILGEILELDSEIQEWRQNVCLDWDEFVERTQSRIPNQKSSTSPNCHHLDTDKKKNYDTSVVDTNQNSVTDVLKMYSESERSYSRSPSLSTRNDRNDDSSVERNARGRSISRSPENERG
ncbi:hypothetical protein HK096_004443, partial [Nowakowskiella sp. JEL0078]